MKLPPLLRVGAALCALQVLPPHLADSAHPSDPSEKTDLLQAGGYVKYLFSGVKLPALGRVYDHLLHARLNGKLFVTNEIRIAAEVRNRFLYGGSVEKIPGYFTSLRPDHDFASMDIVWWNGRSSLGYSELDRFWLDATLGTVQFSLGRQRIAWGTALVWNPTDLFNPLSVLDFDYEERPGVDALRFQYFSSEVTKVEVVLKPGKTLARRVIAGKILLNRWQYDFHFLGGVQGNSPIAGASWAGDIAGAGFRGEVLAKRIEGGSIPALPALGDAWSVSVVLSGDYTFPDNTYLHTEVLFNDRGVNDSTAAYLSASRKLGLLSPARWSLFQELSFDLHPLVRLSGLLIYNPGDGSTAWMPSLVWSVRENFDVSFIGLLFAGGEATEYGGFGQSLFLRGKYSF